MIDLTPTTRTAHTAVIDHVTRTTHGYSGGYEFPYTVAARGPSVDEDSLLDMLPVVLIPVVVSNVTLITDSGETKTYPSPWPDSDDGGSSEDAG